jgi:tungstate transport system permease protein
MNDITSGLIEAFGLILALDADLFEIIGLTLQVSLTAVSIAAVFGLSLGAALAVLQFPGRTGIVVALNALMGLPPVVVGLLVYLALSRSGPFGVLGLLYTPTAMIIAQTVLVMPIIAAVSRQMLAELWLEYREQLISFGAGGLQRTLTLLWDGRFQLLTAVLTGFGRAIAEVGAVMIVGGNIDHLTRVMTTAIALETRKGNLSLAIGLGIVLISISLIVNGVLYVLQPRRAGFA